MMLEKLAELTQDDYVFEAKHIPKLIIRQLRWLPHIVKPQLLAERVCEIVQIVPFDIQVELIMAIPEIILDSEHQQISSLLIELMKNTPELTQTTLDTLGSLNMNEDSLRSVRDDCIESLDSANVETIPIILRFLLTMASSDNASFVIMSIRQKLDMDAIAQILDIASDDVEKGRSKGKKRATQPQLLILDTFKVAFQSRPFLEDTWLRLISEIDSPKLFRTLDFLVLMVSLSLSTTNKKHAQAVIKKKASSHHLTSGTIKRAVLSHGENLQCYFPVLFALCDYMMFSGLDCFNELCVELYSDLFATSDTFGRQEVIGSLVTHIGTGLEFNIGISLSVLLILSRNEPEKVTPFSIFIKSVLDYLDQLSISQVRQLFEVLSNLAVLNEYDISEIDAADHVMSFESSLLTYLHVVIRKQLGSVDLKYKQIGVLGSVVLIQKHAEKGRMSKASFEQAKKIFDTILVSCREFIPCLSLTFNELAFLVSQGRIEKDFVNWLNELTMDQFMNLFTLDDDDLALTNSWIEKYQKVYPRCVLKPEKWLEMGPTEGCLQIYAHALRILPEVIVESSSDGKPDISDSRFVSVLMCPQFKLIHETQNFTSNDNNLEFFELMLESGIHMFTKKQYSEINLDLDPQGREVLCHALLQGINWLREIINSASSRISAKTAVTCITRIKQILELEEYLQGFLHSLPGWMPLTIDENAINSRKGPFKKVVVSDASLFLHEGEAPPCSPQNPVKSNAKSSKSSKPKAIPTLWDIRELRRYMSEFGLPVFHILEYDKSEDSGGFSPIELEFLISDLMIKVEHHFGRRSRSRVATNCFGGNDVELISRLGTSEVFQKLVDLLPCICKVLEKIAKTLRDLVSDENQLPDRLDQPVINVFMMIMKIFDLVFKWPSFQEHSQRKSALLFLDILGNRLSTKEKRDDDYSFEQRVEDAFEYITRFEMCLLTGEAAAVVLKVLGSLAALVPTHINMETKRRFYSKSFVSRVWTDLSTMKADVLLYLLSQHIATSECSIKTLEAYYTQAFVALADKDTESLDEFPLLNRSTFLTFYKAAFSMLCQEMTKFDHDVHTETDEHQTALEVKLHRLVICFTSAVQLVRRFEQSTLISVILKSSKVFVQAFIKNGVPFLNKQFKHSKQGTIKLLRTLQGGTRILQSVCSESKASRDRSLAASVPPLRKVLETVLYEVKKILADNNNLQAFSIGNLKHRSIKGDEISSQMPKCVSDSEEEDASKQRGESMEICDNNEDETGQNAAMKKKPAKKSRESKPKKTRAKKKTSVESNEQLKPSIEAIEEQQPEQDKPQPVKVIEVSNLVAAAPPATKKKRLGMRRIEVPYQSDKPANLAAPFALPSEKQSMSSQNEGDAVVSSPQSKKQQNGTAKAKGMSETKKRNNQRVFEDTEAVDDGTEEEEDNEPKPKKRQTKKSKKDPNVTSRKTKAQLVEEDDYDELEPRNSHMFPVAAYSGAKSSSSGQRDVTLDDDDESTPSPVKTRHHYKHLDENDEDTDLSGFMAYSDTEEEDRVSGSSGDEDNDILYDL